MTPLLSPVRVVLDTNVVLRALAQPASASGLLLSKCESRRAIAILSKPLMNEYRRVLHAVAERFPGIASQDIELVLRRLRFIGDYAHAVDVRFPYPRDPADEKLIELSIAQRADVIATYDNDLLSLPSSRAVVGKRFRQRLPQVRVLRPEALLGAVL